MQKPKLSIGIASYNGRRYLRELLFSIQQNVRNLTLEVTVVDDASTDGTINMVKNEFPKIKLIVNESNEGLAPSTNKAIKASHGNYYLRLDVDTQVHPNTVESMVEFMEEHPRIGVLGPKLTFPDGSFQPSAYRSWPSPLFIFWEFSFVISKTLRTLRKRFLSAKPDLFARKVAHIIGAAMLIRQETIRQVGLMDPEISFFFDETDWQYRMAKAGWEIWYYPQATIMHVGGQSAEDLYIFANPRNLKSLWRFNRKNFPGKWNQIQFFIAILSGALISLTIGIFMYLPSRFHPHAKTTIDKIIRSFGRVIVWHLLTIGRWVKLALNTK